MDAYQPLKIALLSLPARTESMLEMFFHGVGRGSFVRSSENEADAALFDFDQTESRQHGERFFASSNKPCIAFAMQPGESPQIIWLNKPLSAQALLDASAIVRQRAGFAPAQESTLNAASVTSRLRRVSGGGSYDPQRPKATNTIANGQPAVTESQKNLEKPISSVQPPGIDYTQLPPATVSICPFDDNPSFTGNRPDVAIEQLFNDESLFFDPEYYLHSTLIEAKRTADRWKGHVKIVTPTINVIISYTDGYAHVQADAGSWTEICATPLRERLKLHVMGPNECDDLESKLHNEFKIHDRVETLAWEAGLRASSGRLPINTYPETKVRLVRWPNFTRLAPFPFGIAIAALWASRPVRLVETPSILKIPQKYVFAFYSAALSCGFLEIEVPPDAKFPEARHSRPPSLIERLVSWLGRIMS